MNTSGSKYGGMTVNERLYDAGLLQQFDDAAKSRNQDLMVSLLMGVELSATDAVAIAKAVLADPKRYGY